VGPEHPAIAEGLASGKLGDLPALAAQLDDYYLVLHARDEELKEATPEGLEAFSRARAASAVELAARGEPYEAIYEAGMAANDWPGLQDVVEAALRG
jgi:hypothetical protein